MHKLMFASCLIMLTSSQVMASDNGLRPYIGLLAGTALTSVNKLSDASGSLNTDFNAGYMVGGVAGITVDTYWLYNIDKIRAELEVGYRSNNLTNMSNASGQSVDMKGTVSIINYMINGYLESSSLLAKDISIDLFLMAGAGLATASIDSISYKGTILVSSSNDTEFAYQGGIGAGYKLTKNFTIDTSYRYLGTVPLKLGGVKAEYGSHNILFGVRYAFR